MNIRLTTAIVACIALTATAAQAVSIVTPRPGAVLTAGTQVLVIIEADAGEVLTDVGVVTAEASVTATPLPGTDPPTRFQALITIPLDAIGPELIVAIGAHPDRSLSQAIVQVTVQAGTLDRVSLDAPRTLIRSGEIVQLTVTGLFSDSITRDLTTAERGTTYTTGNSNVMAVNADGLAQARSDGVVELTATNGVKSGSAIVTVSIAAPTGIPTVDPGQDVTVTSGSTVVLDGSGSRDPDGDPMTYRWNQRAGPGAVVPDMNTATLTFTAPEVAETTVLEFALMVTDDKRASSLPASVHVTVNPRQ